MASVPVLKFNNGLTIPALGIGTWKSKPGEVTQAVKEAIDIGYRHIDCAYVYGNEKEVGEAIAAKIKEGVVKREDLFITSKLWNTFHRVDLVERACRETLSNLGLSYLDLYLIHWPMAYKEGPELFPMVGNRAVSSDVDYLSTWHEMEKLQEAGLSKSIGVSNFNRKQLERILANAKIKPVTNQVECHPYLTQQKLSKFLSEHNITLTAYSPLGSPDRPWAKPEDPRLLDDAKLVAIAAKYKKTPAQIVLRYQLDRGHIVIPKSVTKSRIQENFDILNFKLTNEDIQHINGFECNGRIIPIESAHGHKYHPFQNDEY